MTGLIGRPFVKRSPYDIGPLSVLWVLSVTLVYSGQTVGRSRWNVPQGRSWVFVAGGSRF